MIKSIHAIAIALFALVLTPGNECQAQIVGGFYPNWYASSSMNNLQWTKMTDLFYAFAEPTSTGGYTLNNESWLTTLVTKGKTNNVRVHLSFGGATQGSTGWSTCTSTETNRTNFATTCNNLVTTYDLNGINLDWEFPEGSEAVNYADLAVKVRAALDQAEITLGHKVYLTCAVAPLIWNNDGINSTFLGVMDYVMPMAFDDGNCSYCGGSNASSMTMAQNAFLHWTTGIPGSGVAGKGVAANKLVIAIPFYENGGTAYNSFSSASPASYYNDADGYYGGYYYNSDPLIKAKADYLMPKAVAGLWTWELVHDRNDEYSLLGSMYSNVMSYSCVFATPTLGANQSICGQASITLNSGIATATGRTFTWKKDGAIVVNASASANTYTITSAGTYRVEVTQESCTKFDEVIISGTMPAVNLGGPYHLCNPITVTLNSGSDVTGKTFVWEKDNVVIAGATSTAYTAALAGTYTVTVNATGCASVSGTATVSSSLPVPKNDTLCAAGTANLTASIAADWFTAASGGTAVKTNSTSYAPSISTNTTYYIQPHGASATSYTTMRTAFQNNGWQQDANVYATKFDALTSLTLDAVTVNVGGGDVKINIVSIDGVTLVASKTFSALSAGINTLSLGFSLSAGTYYINTVGTVSTALVDVTPASNYSIANVLTVYGEAYWDWTVPYGDNYVVSGDYGFFTNFKVTVGNTCGRTPIDVVIAPSNAKCTTNTPVANFTANKTTACTGEQIIFTDTSGGTATSWSWNFGANATPATATGKGPITVTYSLTGTKTVVLTSTNTYGSNTNTKTNYLTITGTAGAAGAITGNTTVCSGTMQQYSLEAVSGADTYTWTVPTGASIVSGQGTISISVNYTGASAGNLTVTPSNGCGNGTATTVAITVNPLPHPAGAITGNTAVCTGLAQTYSVVAAAGASTYTWTVPSGASIVSGQGTNTIGVNFSTAMVGNISVTPSNTCGNGTTASLSVTVTTIPTNTGIITGVTTICQNQSTTYSVASIPNASAYTWTVPVGAAITNGAGTNTIVVLMGTTSGNVTVVASNNCGNALVASSLTVNVTNGADNAGSISGLSTVCANESNVTYSLVSVNGATGYTWTLPTGATIASGNNSNTVTVNFAATSGNINVVPTSACGNGVGTTLDITVNAIPVIAESIAGPAAVCEGSTQNYNIPTVTNATTYSWTVPTGATILTEATSNAISVDFTGSLSGQLTVKAFHGTCVSNTVTTPITVNGALPQPGVFTQSTTAVCPNTNNVAFAVPIVSGAVSYQWTYTGTGVTLSGTTNAITANFATNATSGDVQVIAIGPCGNSVPQSVSVAIGVGGLVVLDNIVGNATVCQHQTGLMYSINTVSGASGYTWTVPAGANITSGNNTNSITLTAGATSGNITVTPFNNCETGNTKTLALTINTVPDASGTITGNTTVCANQLGESYSILPVNGATAYTWTAPAGASIISGNGSMLVSVDWSDTSGNITVTPNNACGNGTSSSLGITVNPLPNPAGVITGTTSVCANQTALSYSIASVNDASTYSWTIPEGASLTAGDNTNTITVNMGTTSGNIAVTPGNACGNGTASIASITVNPLITNTNAITGPVTVCANQTGASYSIVPITGATYVWTVPTGASITTGSTTNAITLTFGTTSGDVTVTPSNTCGTGEKSILTVAVTPAITPTVSVTTPYMPVCANANTSFTAIPVNGGSTPTYAWEINNIPQNGNNTAIFSGIVKTGDVVNVTLTSNVACASTATALGSLNITTIVAAPSKPSGFTSQMTTVTEGLKDIAYAINPVANTEVYAWTYDGTGVSFNNTNSETTRVDFDFNATSGNMNVAAINACGASPMLSLPVTVNPLITLLHKTENMKVMYYQNGFLHVVNAMHTPLQFDIIDMNGVRVLHGNQVNALIDVSELPTAIYVARLKMNGQYYTLKFQK